MCVLTYVCICVFVSVYVYICVLLCVYVYVCVVVCVFDLNWFNTWLYVTTQQPLLVAVLIHKF